MDQPTDTAPVHHAPARRPGGLEDLLETVAGAGTEDRVAIADIRAALGERAFGPLLAVAGLFAASPLGVIPSLPTILAVTLGLIAAQMVIGRRRIWLPGMLLRRSVGRERLLSVIERVRPLARQVDRMLRPRLTMLTREPLVRLLGAAIVALTILIPPLELFPFMATGPAAAIAAIGIAITLGDGILALAGLLIAAGSLTLIGFLIF